jgi:hypothetical protein
MMSLSLSKPSTSGARLASGKEATKFTPTRLSALMILLAFSAEGMGSSVKKRYPAFVGEAEKTSQYFYRLIFILSIK